MIKLTILLVFLSEIIYNSEYQEQQKSKEDSIKEMMITIKKHDKQVGEDTSKEGADGFQNMDELNNQFKSQKPFMPKMFFEHFQYKLRQEVEDAHGLLNLRYMPTLIDKHSTHFYMNLTQLQRLEMETAEYNPNQVLSPEIEKLLNIEDFDQFYGSQIQELIQEDNYKQVIEQISQFDKFIGLSQAQKGSDGQINDYEAVNYVNQMSQHIRDPEQMNGLKVAQFLDPKQIEENKLSQEDFHKALDSFQMNYQKSNPAKQKELKEKVEKEEAMRRMDMEMYKAEKLKELENMSNANQQPGTQDQYDDDS